MFIAIFAPALRHFRENGHKATDGPCYIGHGKSELKRYLTQRGFDPSAFEMLYVKEPSDVKI